MFATPGIERFDRHPTMKERRRATIAMAMKSDAREIIFKQLLALSTLTLRRRGRLRFMSKFPIVYFENRRVCLVTSASFMPSSGSRAAVGDWSRGHGLTSFPLWITKGMRV